MAPGAAGAATCAANESGLVSCSAGVLQHRCSSSKRQPRQWVGGGLGRERWAGKQLLARAAARPRRPRGCPWPLAAHKRLADRSEPLQMPSPVASRPCSTRLNKRSCACSVLGLELIFADHYELPEGGRSRCKCHLRRRRRR